MDSKDAVTIWATALCASSWVVVWHIGTQAVTGAIVMTVACVGVALINLMLAHLVESNL